MGLLFQLALWSVTAWMSGMLVMILALVAGAALPDSISRPIGESAYGRATRALKLGTVMRRKDDGGVDLFRLTPDSTFNALKVELDDETKYFEDVSKFMGRCEGWPFGLTVERTMAVVSARAADIGQAARAEYESGALEYQETTELNNGQTYTEYKINSLVDVDDEQTFVDPVDALSVVAYDGRPEDPETVEEFTKESQRKLVGSMSAKQALSVLMFFIAGSATAYFVTGIEDGKAPDPGSTIPVVVDLVGVVV